MTNPTLNHRILMLFLVTIAYVLASGCDNIDKQWHEYKSDHAAVLGKNSKVVEVISHRWKLIEKSTSNSYEWGWEVTIKIHRPENDKNKALRILLGIEGIEYTLQDKDGFILVSSQLNLDNYDTVIIDNGKKGPMLQEYGQTKTYRQTAEIPLHQAKRAALGNCRILLQY